MVIALICRGNVGTGYISICNRRFYECFLEKMEKIWVFLQENLAKNSDWRNNTQCIYRPEVKILAVKWNHQGSFKKRPLPGPQPERSWRDGLAQLEHQGAEAESSSSERRVESGFSRTQHDICLGMIWVNMWKWGYQISGWGGTWHNQDSTRSQRARATVWFNQCPKPTLTPVPPPPQDSDVLTNHVAETATYGWRGPCFWH